MRQNGGNEFARLLVLLGIIVVGWLLTFPGCGDQKQADHGRRPAHNHLASATTV